MRVEKALEERKKLQASQTTLKEKYGARASTSDPEARVMRMADNGYRPALDMQLAVDTDSDHRGRRDRQRLEPAPSSGVADGPARAAPPSPRAGGPPAGPLAPRPAACRQGGRATQNVNHHVDDDPSAPRVRARLPR